MKLEHQILEEKRKKLQEKLLESQKIRKLTTSNVFSSLSTSLLILFLPLHFLYSFTS